ncbi:MAG: hypothetical protein AUJ92_14365 [Armatimonadetes bacterium CG2_30_59_28]|nr:sugar phosphate isomerase/epimerase [Armatimonadota bacterium]OIO92399.1 MAG: hypothetical protein AUJ92_14365 [Armatimonadetes bacterium CG2_30_59_28]PIU63676.1 MAG: hypothetical protein COS85_15335 [Armatimonadetes bacterium CG07_land_8_20_14_0_80_59_28]PIX41872.1 MAG: hypothetical protein COZ56_10760 [Armatimonadetes bacterium CG_4_8_14_3_um_filter_58_9]PIY48776.1 MAG: hypothetical protein COZ05_02195 [Armatimonadetes bacterium CG_4_10_14_3_um_filter_59_10]PJB67475.1 MAG: hypothetical pr
MKFCFMTWVCPEWDTPTIIEKCRQYGYHGVEFRVECDHKHGVELDASPDHLRWVQQSFANAGVETPCIATSQRFSSNDPAERRQQVDVAKRYVELAAAIEVPIIRVFGGPIPEGVDRRTATSYIAEALRELGAFADQHDVVVGLETHDHFSLARDAVAVINETDHPRVRCLWDIMHPVSHGETMAEAFSHVKPHVVHCHIHDGRRENGNIVLTFPGEGIVDHREAVQLLQTIGFDGHLSGEFINWLPPDEVLPKYAETLSGYLREIEEGREHV